MAMLWRGMVALEAGGVLAAGLCRALAGSEPALARCFATADNNGRPLSADPGVSKARRQQPSSLSEPPLLHDSLSEANYDYRSSARAAASGPRLSSITEPDYYLHNSMSEGTYGLPQALQRTASLNPMRGQGFSTAKQRSTMQRIVVASRAQGHERLHDSFAEIDYDSPYKGGRR